MHSESNEKSEKGGGKAPCYRSREEEGITPTKGCNECG